MSELIHGECLEELAKMDDKCIDMVLCDLPYGTTRAKWDSIIDLDLLWPEVKRVIKDKRAMVFTAGQPFTSALIMSNPKEFRHEWIWDKITARGHLVAKKRPMQQHESVVVFSRGGALYNPQMVLLDKPTKAGTERKRTELMGGFEGATNYSTNKIRTHKYPKTIQTFSMDKNVGHPTQKPVALFEYMIKTYSNPGDTVLDMTAGSGTTAIAALNTGREYICIEQDDDYFEMMKNRVASHVVQTPTTM